MGAQIEELMRLIHSVRCLPGEPLFFINPREYVRVYEGHISTSRSIEDWWSIRNLRCERGPILDLFSKLEFLVNMLIKIKICGDTPDRSRGLMLDELLVNTDLFSRIKLLEKWGIIDKKLSELLMQTKGVRNGLAHAWSESEVQYKGEKLETNFSVFKKDFETIWHTLSGTYATEQERILPNVIERIKKLNQINEPVTD